MLKDRASKERGGTLSVPSRSSAGALNRPLCRYGSHSDFYCFERNYGMLFEIVEIKMAAVSAKRSNGDTIDRN